MLWSWNIFRVTATCIRVPILRAHSESINLTFEKPLSEADARWILSEAPGVRVIDDREANKHPEPLEASGGDDVLVGRIRRDLSQDDDHGLDLFVAGDQLRKGAALNAVQIAELLLKREQVAA
jgi:aspartate-semialdehyde dehydrogenase